MTGVFPNQDWLRGFMDYLNSNDRYANIAKNWEGDLVFEILADGPLSEDRLIYLDLWHGSCRSVSILESLEGHDPLFILTSPFSNFAKLVKGEMEPMQAMLTRKLEVKGSMVYLMKNVPTVLEFVRCAQESTDKVLGEE